ncbi:hypothetical protein [Desulfitobacterium sp. AusDCA]|uniref:hypothetical protein n=1 Tax=Desulfitobacterium sp. AusDCA TaxID=3240383 RepID=UPI003DA792BE
MKKVLYIILIVSLTLNIALIYKHTENAKSLNITWSNALFVLNSTLTAFNLEPVDNRYEPTLNQTRIGLNQLTFRLENLRTLPQGYLIVSPEIISKVFEVTNYENKLLDKIENDLKKSNTISHTDYEEIDKLNKAWSKVSDTLQKETNKIHPLVFRVEQWKMVLDKTTNELNGLELLPLTE